MLPTNNKQQHTTQQHNNTTTQQQKQNNKELNKITKNKKRQGRKNCTFKNFIYCTSNHVTHTSTQRITHNTTIKLHFYEGKKKKMPYTYMFCIFFKNNTKK